MRNLAVAVVLALGACGDDGGSNIDAATQDGAAGSDAPGLDGPIDGPAGAGLVVNGVVTGTGPTGPAIVIWQVTSGSPDYIYKYGEGTVGATTFMVTLDGPPPAAAINSYGIAVGFVVLLPTSTIPPDGIVDESVFGEDDPAFSALHAIIYKAPGAMDISWTSAFPEGYACGVCVMGSGTFDSYEPVACDTVVVDHAPMENCNWT